MFVLLITALILTTTLPTVTNLSCYVTQIQPNRINGLFTNKHQLQDCQQQELMLLNQAVVLPPHSQISCFKITATDPLGHLVDTKGCFVTGSCNNFMDRMRNVTDKGKSNTQFWRDSKCYECNYGGCNGVTRFLVNFFVLFVCFFGLVRLI